MLTGAKSPDVSSNKGSQKGKSSVSALKKKLVSAIKRKGLSNLSVSGRASVLSSKAKSDASLKKVN